MHDITHSIHIRASPERVYQALTATSEVRLWWTHDAELDSHVGGSGEFAFHDRSVVTKIRVATLHPASRAVWIVLSSNAPGGWERTLITFDLQAEASGTTLLFAHRGFQSESEGFRRVAAGWAHYLESLRLYLETGSGMPH